MAQSRDYPEVMTIEQVAEYLQLHPQVVYRHVRAGTLPVSRIGRTIRFKKSVLDAFLESGAWSSAGKFIDFANRKNADKTDVKPPATLTPPSPPHLPAIEPKQTADPKTPRRPTRFSADID
ncbi:MAG TPA: helix-turn-helix domain-containing protein [Planctomycetota bacterium]|nr:helix-turn-helix domain-containing protein [Planctomycetota bacterium]